MPNPEGRLLPGENTKVKVLLDVVEGAITVPRVAVWGEGKEKYVFVVSSDGVVEKRPVSIGEIVGNIVIVTSGLTPGEMVATDKLDMLSDGITVNHVSSSVKTGQP